MTRARLVIVGGGPYCTYALERLAMLLRSIPLPAGLDIAVFDRTGRFGAGATHSDAQARTSYMNRVASQIAFAADESNPEAGGLMPRELRPTFWEWAQEKYRASGDERFNLRPSEVPLRYLHGEALREAFDRYVEMLRGLDGVRVDLYPAEVTDISRAGDGRGLEVEAGAVGLSLRAGHVLLVTGHSNNHPAPGSLADRLARHAAAAPPARYIPYAYPLEEQLGEEAVPAGCRLGILGLGLTAVDMILHLTEGRGGRFVEEVSAGPVPPLRYAASGREPEVIVAVSPSGMLTACRPENAKAVDGSAIGHAALEHRGVFLSTAAVEHLRRSVGTPARLRGEEVRQLDFERHIFPLVVLEMAYVYYRTLLGEAFGRELRRAARQRYRAFLREGSASRDEGIAYLLAPVQEAFDALCAAVQAAGGGAATALEPGAAACLAAFRRTVYGAGPPAGGSPWGHAGEMRAHRFEWLALFDPLAGAAAAGGDEWQRRIVSYMQQDHLAAAQGNLQNPAKAASDGVWRDLRGVLSAAVDHGGLTAESQRRFADVYLRFYTRMSNGTGLVAMRKVLALIESGRVDLSVGPSPCVEPVAGSPSFRITGSVTGARREVGVMACGRSHPFDAELDQGALYPNLLRRGLVRRFRNPGAEPGEGFEGGALDLDRTYHPIQRDGGVEPRLTILGAPTEGLAYFQLSAARPRSNSLVLNNVARWANELVAALTGSTMAPVYDGDGHRHEPRLDH